MRKLTRFCAAAVLIAASAYFLLPLSLDILHIGMIYPAAFFLLIATGLLFPAAVKQLFSGKLRKAAVVCTALLTAAAVCISATLCVIAFAAADAPAENEEVTVVVLGCQVVGEEPSLMLRERIEAAYDYLRTHPDAVCIATGGKGERENISEAACIRKELVEMGIDHQRIYLEDQSVNTMENMKFSAQIIAREGLSTTIAVASDNFHQLRAAIYAGRSGLDARSLGCSSLWLLGPGYWAREVLALYAAFIRGY